jgi:hypothetical protein
MDPQTIDLDHGRPVRDTLEEHALEQLNGLELRVRRKSQPLSERFGDNNAPGFIHSDLHAIN